MRLWHGIRQFYDLIFYRKSGNEEIEITRILHERMDIEDKLSD